MKRSLRWILLVAASLALAGGEARAARGVSRREERSGGGGGRNDHDGSGGVLSPASPVQAPSGNGGGKGVRRRSGVSPAPAGAIARPGVVRDMNRRRRAELSPGRVYWHRAGGVRYGHAYHHGLHWYGFHHGPRVFWTAYHNDYYWWHEPVYDRWVFWWGGGWWWPGPANVVYVYRDGDYLPAEEVPERPSELPAPPPDAAAPSAGGSWKSDDGRRMVQVTGPDNEAFLYDTTGANPAFLKSLGRDAEQVRFSGGKDGKPLQVLVDRQGGSFTLFNEDGAPLETK